MNWLVLSPLWLSPLMVLVPIVWLACNRRPYPSDGHCPECRYNLNGNVSGVCPECGAAVQGDGTSDRLR